MQKQIIQAIKNFDIEKLKVLLDDDLSYMDVTKSLFIKSLKKEFDFAKKNDCHKFDDVFFGICESCNKGCEGMTFLSNDGYYLDLYIEGKDEHSIDDIYICNKLTNVVKLDKIQCLGFSFYNDELLKFRPTSEYTLVKDQYALLRSELKNLEHNILLDKFENWYSSFQYIRDYIDNLGPFASLDYKLFMDASHLLDRIERVLEIKKTANYAIDALISYEIAQSERDKLIWYYENQSNLYSYAVLSNPKNSKIIELDTEERKLAIDISGYEYVLDYFIKLDNLYDDLMKKYKPLPQHFEQAENRSIEHSLETYLRLHNMHLDIVNKYEESS